MTQGIGFPISGVGDAGNDHPGVSALAGLAVLLTDF